MDMSTSRVIVNRALDIIREKTPAEYAQAALAAIERDPETFNMSDWVKIPGVVSTLPPDEAPSCGTTLCAAGWVSHVGGFKLDSEGRAFDRNGVYVSHCSELAEHLLQLDDYDTFWYDSSEIALDALRRIASGEDFHYDYDNGDTPHGGPDSEDED